MNEFEELRDEILDEYKRGNIVYVDIEGIKALPLKRFAKQPIDGILYDLNRLEEVILSNIDKPSWVNDYALVKLLRYYYTKSLVKL